MALVNSGKAKPTLVGAVSSKTLTLVRLSQFLLVQFRSFVGVAHDYLLTHEQVWYRHGKKQKNKTSSIHPLGKVVAGLERCTHLF